MFIFSLTQNLLILNGMFYFVGENYKIKMCYNFNFGSFWTNFLKKTLLVQTPVLAKLHSLWSMTLKFPTQVSCVSVHSVSEKHESFSWLGIYQVSVHSLVSHKEKPWCGHSQSQVSWHPSVLDLTEICRISFDKSFCYSKFSWNDRRKTATGDKADKACSCSLFSQSKPDKGWSLSQLQWVAFPMPLFSGPLHSVCGDGGVLGALSKAAYQ